MIKPEFIFLFIFFAGCTVQNNSIYIDNQIGSDSNPGTARKPIKTISELNSRLQSKSSNIYFMGGQVYDGTLILNQLHVKENEKILITSTSRKRATINGGNNEAIRIEDCSGIVISSLRLKGNGRKDGNMTNGLSLKNTTSSRIVYVRAEGFRKSGVDLFDCRDVVVRNVTAVNNGFSGINVMGSSREKSGKILIIGSRAGNNAGDPSNLDNHSGNGILVGVSDSVTIERCTATNNGWDMPRTGNGPVGIWTWESSHVKIQFCMSYQNKTSKGAKDGGGFDLDGGVRNSVVQYCLSFGNQGAGFGLFQYAGASQWKDNIIRNNISIDDATTTRGAGSIFIWNGTADSTQLSGCKISHNLFISSSAPLISFEPDSKHSDFEFSHNIFIGSHNVSGQDNGSTFLKNTWLGGKHNGSSIRH